jgi:hypothetical protein
MQLHRERAALDPQIMFLNIFFVHHIDRLEQGSVILDSAGGKKTKRGGAPSRPELVF